MVQEDVSKLGSLSASGLRYRRASVTPPRHLIGTRPSREWEIGSLKIGCPLFWLSPPSIPPPRHKAGSPGRAMQKRVSPSRTSWEVPLDREVRMGSCRGDAKHSTGGRCLPALLLLGKSDFQHLYHWRYRPGATGGVGTEPHRLSLPSRMVSPAESLQEQSS